MKRSRTHRWIGWMGMLAIALTVAMPVIARLSPPPGAPTGMAGMAACDMHDGHRDPPAAPGVPVTTRCGYCDLLGHMPVLLAFARLPVFAPLPPVRSGPAIPAPRRSVRGVLVPAPRGPPGGLPT